MSTATSEVKVKTISTPELKDLLDSKRPVEFWNVLTNEYFKGENIAGSRRVPLDQIGNEVRTSGLARDAQLVVYCAGRHCPQSRLAAEKLEKLGYRNAFAYEGGLEEWKAAGYSIEKV